MTRHGAFPTVLTLLLLVFLSGCGQRTAAPGREALAADTVRYAPHRVF